MTPQIWISIGLITLYIYLQIYDSFITATTKTDTKSRLIEKLRSQYKVTIRTFRARKPAGTTTFRSVWINERMLRSEKGTKYIFHHEYYHYTHNHKKWLLVLRFLLAITPLTKYFVNWGLVILIILLSGFTVEYIRQKFEDEANDYAKKMIS